MKKINKFAYLMVATLAFLFTACDEGDNTGYSLLTPGNPAITIDAPVEGFSLIETDTTFTFDVSLSEPQVTDIALYISVIGGTATVGTDFKIDNPNSRVYFAAGKTTGKVSISVMADELLEETETVTIQIGDNRTANATVTPVTVDFTLQNITENDLVIGLSWTTDVTDAIGLELDPDEVIDLRLLMIDVAADNIYTIENEDSFENLTLSGIDVPDGEYLLAVDIFSTIDVGEYNAPVTLDLELQFDQAGTINHEVINYPAAMTNQWICESYKVNLATVTKSGGSYTIENTYAVPFSPYVGDWLGTDVAYDSQVNLLLGCELYVYGLNHGWMEDVRKEEIIKEENVLITIDEMAGTVEILEQDYITTLSNGNEYLHTISGTGTIDVSGDYPTMIINYEVFRQSDGLNLPQWAANEGLQEDPFFTATLTLDPDGLPDDSN